MVYVPGCLSADECGLGMQPTVPTFKSFCMRGRVIGVTQPPPHCPPPPSKCNIFRTGLARSPVTLQVQALLKACLLEALLKLQLSQMLKTCDYFAATRANCKVCCNYSPFGGCETYIVYCTATKPFLNSYYLELQIVLQLQVSEQPMLYCFIATKPHVQAYNLGDSLSFLHNGCVLGGMMRFKHARAAWIAAQPPRARRPHQVGRARRRAPNSKSMEAKSALQRSASLPPSRAAARGACGERTERWCARSRASGPQRPPT